MTSEDVYNRFNERLQNNSVGNNIADEEIDVNVALLDEQHSPDLGDHATFSDVSDDEITNTAASDTGYTQGGQTLTGKILNVDTDDRNVDFDADDVTFSDSTIDARYVVVYHAEPADETDQDLILLVDLGEEKSSENADFTIEWSDDGIWRFDSS